MDAARRAGASEGVITDLQRFATKPHAFDALRSTGAATNEASEALTPRVADALSRRISVLKGGAIVAGIGLAGWAAYLLMSRPKRPSWQERIDAERAAQAAYQQYYR